MGDSHYYAPPPPGLKCETCRAEIDLGGGWLGPDYPKRMPKLCYRCFRGWLSPERSKSNRPGSQEFYG